MEEIVDLLIHRLSPKGITPLALPRFLKDILYIIGEGSDFSPSYINTRLENLGWGVSVIDQHTFDLIIAFLERETAYDDESRVLH